MKKLIWLPRIILILQILFFGFFSLDADIHKLLILFIPVYILTIVLLASYKTPWIASFLTFIVMIVFAISFSTLNYYMKFLVITFPQFITFILFIFITIFTLEHRNKINESQKDNKDNSITHYNDEYFHKY